MAYFQMTLVGESVANERVPLVRIVREFADPGLREAWGPVQIDEPRSARADEPWGPGQPV